MLFCVHAFGNQEEIKTVSLHTEAVAHRAFERVWIGWMVNCRQTGWGVGKDCCCGF